MSKRKEKKKASREIIAKYVNDMSGFYPRKTNIAKAMGIELPRLCQIMNGDVEVSEIKFIDYCRNVRADIEQEREKVVDYDKYIEICNGVMTM